MFRRTLVAGASLGLMMTFGEAAQIASPDEDRDIAKEAYIYGFPMVDGYQTLYAPRRRTGVERRDAGGDQESHPHRD